MTTLLCAFTIALILFTAWRHWMVVRFFRRAKNQHRPPPGQPPRLVSILQPILSGDPTLPQTLAHNLAARSTYAREFIWLVDEDDAAGQTNLPRPDRRSPRCASPPASASPPRPKA